MKYIVFETKDPRKGQVARMDDGTAQRLIDSGNAREISAEEAEKMGGARAGATVSGTENGRADRADGVEERNGTVQQGVTGVRYAEGTGRTGEGSGATASGAPASGEGAASTSGTTAAPAPGAATTQSTADAAGTTTQTTQR